MSHFKVLVMFSFLLSISGVLKAGDLDYYNEIFNVYKNQMHPRLLRQLPSNERKKLSQLELVLIESPRLVMLAGTEKRDKKVYISVGFLDGIYNYIDCILLEDEFSDNNICNPYFDYYFNRIVSDKPKPPWPVARLHLRDDDRKLKIWATNADIVLARKLMFFSAIINVMMHEYGHHIVGFHNKGASISDMRRLEGAVDKWSFKKLNDMGEKPALGAVIALGYLAQVERYRNELQELHENDPEFRQVPRTHPKPHQRIEFVYNLSCRKQLKDNYLRTACPLLRRSIALYK